MLDYLKYVYLYWKSFFRSLFLSQKESITLYTTSSSDSASTTSFQTISPSSNSNKLSFIFNPENIITDKELLNCSSMTEEQIQNFLVLKDSFLKNYKINEHLISYWIYKYSNDNGINPQILITNMQKEQGLISQKTPPTKQRRLDYGLGVGAYDDHDDPKWKGFDKQIEGSILVCSKRYKKAILNKYPFSYVTGEKRTINIQNAATKVMYDYTPWIGDENKIINGARYDAPFGNYLFFKIWTKWFC